MAYIQRSYWGAQYDRQKVAMAEIGQHPLRGTKRKRAKGEDRGREEHLQTIVSITSKDI